MGSAVVRALAKAGRPVRAIVEPGANVKNLDDSIQRAVDWFRAESMA